MGDRFFSLEHGPIVSRVYDLARFRVEGSDMECWSEYFAPRQGNRVSLLKQSNLDDLSDREIEALRESWNEIKNLSFRQLRDMTHNLPRIRGSRQGLVRD